MSNEVQTTQQAQLPANIAARGVNIAQWNTLCDSLFPGAKTNSILMVLDYCKARSLDPMKKPCHIVPISVKEGDRWVYRDVIMPGIYEYRITAQRTKLYLGHTAPEYGPFKEQFGVNAPEWCSMTMYRWHEDSQTKTEFPVTVWFAECCATKDGKANQRWAKAPIQMLTKCCEAAGLREAFPDELGGTHTDDEMYGKAVDVEFETVAASVVGDKNPAGWTGPKADKPEQEERKRRGKPKVEEPKAVEAKSGDGEGVAQQAQDCITLSQQKLLEHRLAGKAIPINEFLATFEIGELIELPFDKMQEASAWIEKR